MLDTVSIHCWLKVCTIVVEQGPRGNQSKSLGKGDSVVFSAQKGLVLQKIQVRIRVV